MADRFSNVMCLEGEEREGNVSRRLENLISAKFLNTYVTYCILRGSSVDLAFNERFLSIKTVFSSYARKWPSEEVQKVVLW